MRKPSNKTHFKCLLETTTSNRFLSLNDSEDGLPEEDESRYEKVCKMAKKNHSRLPKDKHLTKKFQFSRTTFGLELKQFSLKKV